MLLLLAIFVILSFISGEVAQQTQEKVINKTGRCDHGYKYFNDSCYFFSCRRCRKNFYDAQAFCERYGGNLVSIHSQQENDFLMQNSNNFITGLYYSENEKQFYWADNSTFNFKKLSSSFRRKCGHFGRCVRVKNNIWDNAGCYRQFRWICQKKPLVLASICPEQNSEPLLDGGLLRSPGYPSEYFIGTSTCYYNLVVKTDELITIIFNKTDLYYDPLSTNFDHDEIEIYEGFEEDAKLIGRVTGATEPGTAFETEKLNEMTIRFHSGSGTNRTGLWLATWFPKPNKRLRYAEAYRKYISATKNVRQKQSLKPAMATIATMITTTPTTTEILKEQKQQETSTAATSKAHSRTSLLPKISTVTDTHNSNAFRNTPKGSEEMKSLTHSSEQYETSSNIYGY